MIFTSRSLFFKGTDGWVIDFTFNLKWTEQKTHTKQIDNKKSKNKQKSQSGQNKNKQNQWHGMNFIFCDMQF